jgi:DNA polymerase/3'-5' exonuclease PolX
MNQELIRNLNDLAKYYKLTGDRWRDQAYQKAIVSIKAFPSEITSVSQVKKLPGVGAKIQEKINQFLTTGMIRQVGEVSEKKKRLLSADTKTGALHRLEKVWGVGPVKANELYSAGITTIEALKTHKSVLNRQQLIGLKYYDDLGERIQRDDILIFNEIMVYTLNKAFGAKTYRLEIAGSYRRGEPDSGDVDCLLLSDNFNLEQAVEALKKRNVITDVLSQKGSKFEGIAHSPSSGEGRHFRLDIEFVQNEDEWGSELLYFTGNKGLNIMLRGYAKKRGLILNQHGLFQSNGRRIPVYTEKEIFEILGVDYIPPERR